MSADRTHCIAVIPGDGGARPKVAREGLKALEAAATGFRYRTGTYDPGAGRRV